MAILKFEIRYPGAKHGSRKRQNSHRPFRISIRPAGTPTRRFLGSAISRGRKSELHRAALPRFVPGCRFAPLKIAASGAKMRPPRNDIKMVGFNLPFLQSNYLNLSLLGRRPNFAACATAPLTKSSAGAGFAGFRKAPRACFPRRSVPRP